MLLFPFWITNAAKPYAHQLNPMHIQFKSFIQSLLKQNYQATHAYHRVRLWLEGLRNRDKIVVYTTAKVGSNTVWKSLRAVNLGIPIYHIHTLNPEKIESEIAKNKTDFPTIRFVNPETAQSEYLRSQLTDQLGQRPWSIVTLVRDPIARQISVFFERIENEIAFGKDYRKEAQKQGNEKVLQTVVDRFFEEQFNNSMHKEPLEWFDSELKRNLNIDVFTKPPLKNKGYSIYKSQLANVLLLKLESLDNCCQSAFQEFLGLQDFQLTQANIALKKRYKSLYKAFLQKVRFPSEYIDKVYSAESVRHIYSDAELDRFSQRWRSE